MLRNRLGITRLREMQQAESEALLDEQEWAIGHFRASHRFTAADVALLHRSWLGSIYPWAGVYRQVNFSQGGLMFAAAAQVPRLMAAFEADELARLTPGEGMDEPSLTAALAHTHAELVLIHPFREGNGRCARLMGWLMALQAGRRWILRRCPGAARRRTSRPSGRRSRTTTRRWNAASAACWRGLRALARRAVDGASGPLAEGLENALDGGGARRTHPQQIGPPAWLAQPGIAVQQGTFHETPETRTNTVARMVAGGAMPR